MELHIGNNIRRLRRERNLTQEEVAAHLGISFQAISKWERGDGYPDITLLPALASYFQTTTDELLGVNELASEEIYNQINREWAENRLAGRHAENVALMREALKRFPNDALLLVQLSSSLERLDGTDAEKRDYLRQSIAVQEQILRGEDSEVRSATQFNICFAYMKYGETDKAVAQAKKLPKRPVRCTISPPQSSHLKSATTGGFFSTFSGVATSSAGFSLSRGLVFLQVG
jgi:transcriptional regulator with XRE-family HTH domain